MSSATTATGPSELVVVPEVDLSAYEPQVARQLADARESLDQLVGTPGANPVNLSQTYGTLGKLYQAYGLLPAAQACYSNAGAIMPKQLVWPYLYAVVASDRGRRDEAISALKYVLVHKEDDLPSRIRLARILRENGDHEAAQEQLIAAGGEKPSMPVVLAELGELALAKGNSQEAVEHLSYALEQVPGANRLHYPLAIALRNLGKAEEARSHMAQRGDVGIKVTDPYLEEIEQLKVGERVHLLRGKLAYGAGDYLAAEKAFREAVAAKPDSSRARVNLGATLSALGQAKESQEQFAKVLESDPDNLTAHYNLGTTALHEGKLDIAAPHLKKVVELSPDDTEARLHLASILIAKNEFAAAFEQYQETAKLDSSSQTAWMGMVNMLISAEQFPEAVAVLAQAHQALPNDGRIRHARARMLAASPDQSLRDAAMARRLAYQSYQEAPNLERAYTVSLALAESGECKQAASFLDQAWPKFVADKSATPQKVRVTVEYYQSNSPCRSAPVW
ncbi:MAG: tetratricopeptide repeat protein [Pseudomonadota bacterium]